MVLEKAANPLIETVHLYPTGVGRLSGLKFAVKDVIDIKGHQTTWGNPTWRDTHPLPQANAVCVEQLLSAGAQCVGKTVTSEFSRGMTGTNHFFGTPLNPKAPDRAPGGSSSGSASVVASGLVDFALGTDTGGSVRVPASYCGIYGMRPSTGLISLAGVNYLSYSFDTLGAFARSSTVLSSVMSVLLAQNIPASVNVGTIYLANDAFKLASDEITKTLAKPLTALKKVYPNQTVSINNRDIDPKADDPVKGWGNTFRTILCAETWNTLGAWLTSVNLELGKTTYVDFSTIQNLDRTQIGSAVRQREQQFLKLNNWLYPNNLLCLPTTPDIAPARNNTATDYARLRPLLCIAGIGRLPQVSIPIGNVNSSPVGLSLIAAYGQDAFLLSVVNHINLEFLKLT